MDFEKLVRLNPLNDFAFQKAMGEKGDEPQLIAFLSAVLERTGKGDITSVKIIENKDLMPDIVGGKSVRLDVLAEAFVKTERLDTDIEVQIKNEFNMEKRSLYYWASRYINNLDSGKDYAILPTVVAVNIIGFGYFPIMDYHTSFHLWEDRHKELQLTDVCEIHFLDIVKFRKLRAKKGFSLDDPLNRWMVYFDKKSPQKMITEVLQMDETIQQFQEKLEWINRDKVMMRIYDQYEKTERDWISSMNGAERKGRAEERAEITALLKQGVSLEELKARYGV